MAEGTAERFTLHGDAGADLLDIGAAALFGWVPEDGNARIWAMPRTVLVDGQPVTSYVPTASPSSASGLLAFMADPDSAFAAAATAVSFTFTTASADSGPFMLAPDRSWSWDPLTGILDPGIAPVWNPLGHRGGYLVTSDSVTSAWTYGGQSHTTTERGAWVLRDAPPAELRLLMGAGDDTARGAAGAETLEGEAGDDRLFGGDERDRLRGGDGDDVMDGQRGNDFMHGDAGADVLSGGSGDDWLTGGTGHDILFGSAGDDRLQGGPGHDRLIGGPGRDFANFEGPGRLFVDLGAGTAMHGAEPDRLEGIESVSAYTEEALILGDDGANDIWTGAAADTLVGGAGDDELYAADGDDRLTGGTGADRFFFGDPDWSEDSGDDVITDFSVAEGDRIDAGMAWLAGDPTLRQDGADTIVTIAMISGSIRLLGVARAELDADASWFVPAEEPEWLPH